MTLAGHGCPRWCEWIAAVAIVCACASALPCIPAQAQIQNSNQSLNAGPLSGALANATDLAIELRAVWGGGPARSFAGSIEISDGSIEIVRNLSIQDDAAAAVLPGGRNQLVIRPHTPASFGGVDLRIKGKPDSQLTFVFSEPGSSQSPETVQVPLKQLLAGRELFTIDKRGSKLALERQLHDRVRVRLNQGESILRLGDAGNVMVEGYRTGLAAGDYRLNLRLQEAGIDRALVQLHHDITVDDQGSFASTNFNAIELPQRAGVYAFDVSIVRKRLINSLMSNATLPNRRLEFVIAPDQQVQRNESLAGQPGARTEWQTVSQVYPAGASWWDSLGKFRIPTVKTLSPLVTQVARPMGSGEHQRQMVGDKECMVLATGAWQAFPLTIEQVGVPHRVSIDVPADMPQKLVFSVHEPSAASDAPSLRLDTGMLVEAGTVTAGGLTTHHMLFWPKSSHSYFLVMNADAHQRAALAEINLQVATTGLQSSVASDSPLGQSNSSMPVRTASIYLDKPLLAENFGAMRRVEGRARAG